MATPKAAPADAVATPFVDAPTAPSFAASVSNIAYDKNTTQKTGALCTGMGYAPDVDPASTTATQYMGGATLTIGYHLPG
jgi:hypothetical protein